MAMPLMIEMLQSDNPQTRSAAAYALGRMGPQARPALAALIAALKQQASDDFSISNAISRIGPAAVPALLEAAADDSHPTEPLAAALAGIGPAAVEALIAALSSDNANETS